ncbi:class I SAM-dependent methyltransferase [Pseudomonas sp. CMR5c]|uniref:class I SAM-dependent methyltransferase n=1 Tax=Pseudomonas TaxID=286 RepID=UPI00069F3E24|nr:class I SAM-dependent methyltransferase [Pseudomonas sp. CMR5c]
MSDNINPDKDQRVRAEFDLLADEYHDQHKENVAITGENPEFFSEYKIADLAALVADQKLPSASVFDFGSGIGNSLPFFRKYFPDSAITCGDVSSRSIEIAKIRFPGDEKYVQIENTIPLPTHSQDIVFTACVFHHIPHEDHEHWLKELLRITKPGGILTIYEHNPLNPLTVKAVNTCPLDVNAELILGRTMAKRATAGGWAKPSVDYKLFFPAFLSYLRPLERKLNWLALGAQYRMFARAPE